MDETLNIEVEAVLNLTKGARKLINQYNELQQSYNRSIGQAQENREAILEFGTFMESLSNGVVPAAKPKVFNKVFESYLYRTHITNTFNMWALVTQDWVNDLAQWIGNRSCLEIMAGKGWLSLALSNAGISTYAVDDLSWEDGERTIKGGHVFPVEHMNASMAIRNYPADVLICSWPPYDEEAFTLACKEWGRDRPIVYIGEGSGGCTADHEFHEDFKVVEEIMIPQWYGMHDYVQIGYWQGETFE